MNTTTEEERIKHQLDRLAELTELVRKDTSIETKELQVEMIDLLTIFFLKWEDRKLWVFSFNFLNHSIFFKPLNF